MSKPFATCAGGTISADIAVPEHEREVRFYSQVLTTGDKPLWREDLMNNLGQPIIGLGVRSPDLEQLPLQWMPHIQVDDIAGSVERALSLGGTEVMHGKDDEGNSQWAVLLDPNQAAFGLIPVVTSLPPISAEDTAAPLGRIGWLDLTVVDAPGTVDFYRQAVGWTVEEVAMSDNGERYVDYNMLDGDGQPGAGICHARGVNQDLPPVWMLYLPVADLAESMRRAAAEGGDVVKEARSSDGGFEYVVIRDPVGVVFALAPG